MNNWGHQDPGDMPEAFNPFEADEDLLAAILAGVLKPEAAPEF